MAMQVHETLLCSIVYRCRWFFKSTQHYSVTKKACWRRFMWHVETIEAVTFLKHHNSFCQLIQQCCECALWMVLNLPSVMRWAQFYFGCNLIIITINIIIINSIKHTKHLHMYSWSEHILFMLHGLCNKNNQAILFVNSIYKKWQCVIESS